MLRAALVRRLWHRIVGSGEVVFPAVPALVDHYLEILERTANALGRPFGDGRESLRRLLLEKLEWAFRRSSGSTVRVQYATSPAPKLGVDWTVSTHELTLDDQYREWPRSHEPPLFGTDPDARLVQLAQSLGPPESTSFCLSASSYARMSFSNLFAGGASPRANVTKPIRTQSKTSGERMGTRQSRRDTNGEPK